MRDCCIDRLRVSKSAIPRFEKNNEIDITRNAQRVIEIPIEFFWLDNRFPNTDVNRLIRIRIVRSSDLKELTFI